ncbi:MAG: hypothetical protein HY042_12140 [Spirochaetia bacterium]|nr:hypothetical protein [Spirochaetia bacterium]
MTVDEAAEISQLFASLGVSQPACELYIDTFRHPYLRFSEFFTLPGSTITGIKADECRKIAELLAAKIPWIVSDCQILPEPRPRRESGQLHLVRPILVDGRPYMFIFKLSAPYMGGAQDEEIVHAAQQGLSPTVNTDRLYFNARLLPVHEMEKEHGHIVDFQAVQIREAIFEVTSKSVGRDVWSTVLFDEVDFSAVNQTFAEMFGHGADWTGGRLFSPVVVDYLTLALNLIWCDRAFVDQIAVMYDRAFTSFLHGGTLAGIANEDRQFWSAYFGAWKSERVSSRAGNPHWQMVKYPDASWIAQFGSGHR